MLHTSTSFDHPFAILHVTFPIECVAIPAISYLGTHLTLGPWGLAFGTQTILVFGVRLYGQKS